MTKPVRLDTELVRRGLAASRAEARAAIEQGLVEVRGMPQPRPGTLVARDAGISLARSPRRFVSRGGDKLDGALKRFAVRVGGRRWLDAGASTGGFTDCLLQGGAAAVIALDVGYGQLHWSLRTDERVIVRERTNVRTLGPGDLPWAPEGVVADLSFISLALVLDPLARSADPDADFVVLVKPQFEVGRDLVGKGGVVRAPDSWLLALQKVSTAARAAGLHTVAAVASDVPGPAGNREFFLHLRRDAHEDEGALAAAVAEVGAGK